MGRTRKLTQNASTAYWVAFGPHGPRALPPPGEGKKVTLYVFAALFASLAIFSTMRMFAKPAPHTMNKEWQEAANEYLKVRIRQTFTRSSSRMGLPARVSMLTLVIKTGAKVRPNHWYLVPQLRGQGPSPVPVLESLRGSGSKGETLPLSVERAEATYSLPRGPSSMYTVIFREGIGPARGWMAIACVDVEKCTKITRSLQIRLISPNLKCDLTYEHWSEAQPLARKARQSGCRPLIVALICILRAETTSRYAKSPYRNASSHATLNLLLLGVSRV